MRLLFLVLIFACWNTLYAQGDLLFHNYTVDEGLESNTVFSIHQHRTGYLYIGHDRGISKFNGHHFQNLYAREESQALANILPIGNDQMICKDFQGNSFLIRNDSLKPFDPGVKETWGFPIYVNDGKKIYFSRNNQFHSLNDRLKGQRIIIPGINIKRIWSLEVSKDTAYLFVTTSNETYLMSVNVRSGEIIEKTEKESGAQIRIYKTKKEIYWIDLASGKIGKYKNGFRPLLNLFESGIPDKSKITDLIQLPDGDFLVATFNGVFRFTGQWKFKGHYLSGIQCSVLYLDQEKSLWIGSLQNGLFYIPNTQLITIRSSALDGKNVKFSCFAARQNEIFAGTYDGRIAQFNEKGELKNTFKLPHDAEIQSMLITDEEIIAYCSELYFIDRKNENITSEKVTSTKAIYSENGVLYLSTSKGLGILSGKESQWYVNDRWILQSFPISENQVLLQTPNEIYSLNISRQQLTSIHSKGRDLCRYEKKYYFRTGKSLWTIDEKGNPKKLKSLKKTLQRIFWGNKGVYALFTDNEIRLIYPEKKNIIIRPEGNWLEEIIFFHNSENTFFIGNHDQILIGSENLFAADVQPVLRLLSVKGNHELSESSYALPYENNEIIFEFDLIPDFKDFGGGQIIYRIPELDKKWDTIAASDHFHLHLVRLPAGNHTLEIKGITSNGKSTNVLTYQLQVDSPYYFQWWFILSILFLLILIVYFIIRWRSYIIRKKNQRELEKKELKLRALNSELTAIRSQMNPHFIFNSLSSIQSKILNEDKLNAYENLSTFALLLRQALQFTSKEFLTLENEMSFIRNYIELEQQRTDHLFAYEEVIDPSLLPNSIEVPSLILQPFVENAIKHGLMHSTGEKKLMIILEKTSENTLRILIRDNGIGIRASKEINNKTNSQHQSFATQAINERIKILQESGKMNVRLSITEPDKGTEVKLEISL